MFDEESLLTPEERNKVEHPKRHKLTPFRDSSKTHSLRMWLNMIFMIFAIVGLISYFYWSHDAGKIIMLVSLVFKFFELTLRILKI